MSGALLTKAEMADTRIHGAKLKDAALSGTRYAGKAVAFKKAANGWRGAGNDPKPAIPERTVGRQAEHHANYSAPSPPPDATTAPGELVDRDGYRL
jgi:hypothetical protein